MIEATTEYEHTGRRWRPWRATVTFGTRSWGRSFWTEAGARRWALRKAGDMAWRAYIGALVNAKAGERR